MKLISLNTWAGRVFEPLRVFLQRKSRDTDIFCFQEVYKNSSVLGENATGQRFNFLAELEEMLPDFAGFFAEQAPGTGLATFVRTNIEVNKIDFFSMLSAEEVRHLISPSGQPYYPRIVQCVSVADPQITILNFHGLPGQRKEDTPERELQTERLINMLDIILGPKVLIGDFNLNPNTKAISAIEGRMRNLIREENVKTTRSSYYEHREAMPIADYCFITPDIKIQHFEVLPDEISDHLPLLVKFECKPSR